MMGVIHNIINLTYHWGWMVVVVSCWEYREASGMWDVLAPKIAGGRCRVDSPDVPPDPLPLHPALALVACVVAMLFFGLQLSSGQVADLLGILSGSDMHAFLLCLGLRSTEYSTVP